MYSISLYRKCVRAFDNMNCVFYNYGDLYGNHMYGVSKRKLTVYSKTGKVLKTIKPDLSKYLKKNHTAYLKMAEVTGKNKVRLYYIHSFDFMSGYGGIIEVNTKTGKVKKIVSTHNYVPRDYDGKYVYGIKEGNKEVSFFRTSLKTKKTVTFKEQVIIPDDSKYLEERVMYTFYKGKIMGLEPSGQIFYGTFDSKKIDITGDVSRCKNFKMYKPLAIAMKSKNEFYIVYDPNIRAHEEADGIRQKLFVVKYHK